MALDATKNFAKVEVSTGYDSAATSVALKAGDGAKLPQPSTDGSFNLTWYNYTDYKDPTDDPNVEIVRCTARSTDTLTITRAQESTTAQNHNTSGKTYKMILGLTAKMITDIESQKITNPMTAQGDIIYGGASGTPTKLAKGTAGQVLKINSGETAPEWGTAPKLEEFQLKICDDATALTTGDGKLIFMIPESCNGMNLVKAHAGVSTVSSSGTPTIQIRNVTDSVDMLSTRITIDASEYTSYTAATAPVIDTTHDDVATGDRIAIDVDAAGTGTKGLIVYLAFQLP